MFKSKAEKIEISQKKTALEAFIAQLSELPQFIKTGKGLLHGINGCLVNVSGDAIELCWVETYSGSDGRRATLYSEDQKEKYLDLMKAQAATLRPIHT